MIAACVLATGTAGYGLAARQCVAALLAHTDFDVHVTCDHVARLVLPSAPRIRVHPLAAPVPQSPVPQTRAEPFLAKFAALRTCLADSEADIVLLVDADAILTRALTAEMIEAQLAGADLAMAEQPETLPTGTGAQALFAHYRDVTLPGVDPRLSAPPEEAFHSYNSGVVLLRREAALRMLDWVAACQGRGAPVPKRHMIADQDYLQVWANNVAPQSARLLPWAWNHCALWHRGFPRPGAVFLHFSNFCQGPDLQAIAAMRTHGRQGPGAGTEAEDMTAIIVSYNSAEVLNLCLEHAAAARVRCILVDNGSADDSVQIARHWGCRIVENGENLGFARACNIGLAAAQTDLVCFLNPDCLLSPEAVALARRQLQRAPRTLLVPNFCEWSGARVSGCQPGYSRAKLLADLATPGGTLARRLAKYPSYDDTGWSWPLAACLFATRDVMQELGGFDEGYFLYMEDVLLGQKAASMGVETRRLNVDVVHLSGRGSDIAQTDRDRLKDAARLQYARDTYGRVFAALAWMVHKWRWK